MRQLCELLLATLLIPLAVAASPLPARSQTASTPGSTLPTATATPSASPSAASVAVAASPSPPVLVAKEIQGLDVFGSDGQQVGKIAKVNVADGAVRDVEVQSGGFLGFFSKTYLLPADKLSKKGGRVELSMTSGQARQFIK
jgi:sporulation protein YlmC with PRC-barrel domain